MSGSDGDTVRLWERDLEKGRRISTKLEVHDDTVRSVFMSRDSKRIVSGAKDSIVRVCYFDQEVSWTETVLQVHRFNNLKSVDISGDGKQVVSGRVGGLYKFGICTWRTGAGHKLCYKDMMIMLKVFT